MKQTNLAEGVRLLTKKIRNYKGVFSLSDASSVTGLAIDEAKVSM